MNINTYDYTTVFPVLEELYKNKDKDYYDIIAKLFVKYLTRGEKGIYLSIKMTNGYIKNYYEFSNYIKELQQELNESGFRVSAYPVDDRYSYKMFVSMDQTGSEKHEILPSASTVHKLMEKSIKEAENILLRQNLDHCSIAITNAAKNGHNECDYQFEGYIDNKEENNLTPVPAFEYVKARLIQILKEKGYNCCMQIEDTNKINISWDAIKE